LAKEHTATLCYTQCTCNNLKPISCTAYVGRMAGFIDSQLLTDA